MAAKKVEGSGYATPEERDEQPVVIQTDNDRINYDHEALQKWPELSQAELDSVDANHKKLVDLVAAKYGLSAEDTERQVRLFEQLVIDKRLEEEGRDAKPEK